MDTVPPVPMTLGGMFSEAFGIVREHAAEYAMLVALFVLPATAFLLLLGGGEVSQWELQFNLENLLGSLVPGAIMLGAEIYVILLTANAMQRKIVRPNRLLQQVAGLFFPYLFAGILVGLSIIVGLFALVVPGLALVVFLGFYGQNLVIGDEKVLDCLVESWRLVRGQFWRVTGFMIVLLLPMLLFTAFLETIVAIPGATVVASFLSSSYELFSATAWTVFYLNLRAVREAELDAGSDPLPDDGFATSPIPAIPESAPEP
jgi:hypothetical protein